MKWNSDYWKPFGVMNPERTMSTHQKKIDKAKDIPYNEIIYSCFEDDVISTVRQKHLFGMNSYIRDNLGTDEKGRINRQSMKDIKQLVNNVTRDKIKEELISNGYPASWDTAFYMLHYKRINSMMMKITKEIVKGQL